MELIDSMEYRDRSIDFLMHFFRVLKVRKGKKYNKNKLKCAVTLFFAVIPHWSEMKYMGCFKDKRPYRALSGKHKRIDTNSIKLCWRFCSEDDSKVITTVQKDQ